MQDKQTILLLNTRKMFCMNENCTHKTFSERFDFVASNGKKTKRLIDKILITSTKLSSVTASVLLEHSSIKGCKSSICDLLKKIRIIVDKSNVTKICVVNFAFYERYTYGTIMIDFETHRIIDVIDFREMEQVEEWFKTYPNIQVVFCDRAQGYASAVCNVHPKTC